MPVAASAPSTTESESSAPLQLRKSAELMTPRGEPQLQPATRGWQAWTRRATFGALSPRAGSDEVAELSERRSVLGQWSQSKTILVANPKGSAGKTPTTIGIAATLGDVRGGGVIAWDNNETLGTLGIRTVPQRFATTAVDLLENLERFERINAKKGELAAFTRTQESGQFHVLASDENPRRMSQIGAIEFARIHTVLTRYYDALVLDTGNNPRAKNFLAALEFADVLVIPLSWDEGHVITAGRLIEQLRETNRGDLVDRAVTVVTGRPGTETKPSDVEQWREWFTATTGAVVEIPFDQHVAGGKSIVYSNLHQRTRRAYLAATAAIADKLTEADEASLYESIKGKNNA